LAAVLLAGAVLFAPAVLLAGESSRTMLASARVSYFYDAKHHGKIRTGSLPMGAPNTGGVG